MRREFIVLLALLLSGCAQMQTSSRSDSEAADADLPLGERIRLRAQNPEYYAGILAEQSRSSASAQTPSSNRRNDNTRSRSPQTRIIRGDGNFINRDIASRAPRLLQTDGEVELNFELADIRDVIKVIFDTLQQNYVLDPRVQGEVTVQTTRPLPKDLLLPTLETLLKANGATLIRSGGVYRVLPIPDAVRGNLSPRLGASRLGPGYTVRIFPLRYISATEMETILQPFAPEGGILLVDPVRNLMILAGTSQELDSLQETINIFDVNWLKGMSIGMYVLENVDSQDMAEELDKLFGPGSELPLAGLFRFIPINRINAIMVITPQADFLKDVGSWIERLDGSGGERLYVYEVQFGEAEYLADLLNQVFGESVTSSAVSSTSSGQVAPGRSTSQLTTNQGSIRSSSAVPSGSTDGGDANFLYQVSEPEAAAPPPIQLGSGPSPGQSSFPAGGITSEVRITADTANNSLLVWASSQNYDKILNALRKLDISPRQVLIEATIAEVSLGDDLQYGLRWYFENRIGGRNSGSGSLELNSSTALDNVLGSGFNYAIVNNANVVRAVLNLLASENRVKILSSPQVMVIDNQEARIQVGDEQPVRVGSTTSDGGNVTENFQYRDTGVLLEVRPQVNAGGLVNLDITQEVIDIGQENPSLGGNPTFLTRTIESKVAVQNNQTIVLGGLIEENDSRTKSGIPILHKLPVVGPLFGSTNNTFSRTELVVLLTPRVIRNNFEAQQVTSELKERMRGIIPLESPWKTRSGRSALQRRNLRK